MTTLPFKSCFNSLTMTSLEVNSKLLSGYTAILFKGETSTQMPTEYKFNIGSNAGNIGVLPLKLSSYFELFSILAQKHSALWPTPTLIKTPMFS